MIPPVFRVPFCSCNITGTIGTNVPVQWDSYIGDNLVVVSRSHMSSSGGGWAGMGIDLLWSPVPPHYTSREASLPQARGQGNQAGEPGRGTKIVNREQDKRAQRERGNSERKRSGTEKR